jgi:prepilin-type N-terminal cleavage/methylation domain-containing protein
MSFNNINTTLRSERGFTIVELLIVIVVIGILAAITIVSFNGVTSKANTTNAAANANAVQKVAEAFNSDNSKYPATTADFTATANSVKLPTGVSLLTGSTALSNANGKTSILYKYKGASTAPTGGSVSYWDFTTGAASTTVIYVGDGKSGDTFTTPAS